MRRGEMFFSVGDTDQHNILVGAKCSRNEESLNLLIVGSSREMLWGYESCTNTMDNHITMSEATLEAPPRRQ